jgi:hypothetical protein
VQRCWSDRHRRNGNLSETLATRLIIAAVLVAAGVADFVAGKAIWLTPRTGLTSGLTGQLDVLIPFDQGPAAASLLSSI